MLCGCRDSQQAAFVSSDQVLALDANVQQPLNKVLNEATGSFQNPILLGHDDKSQKHLKLGQQVYQLRCMQCHGVSGDGRGTAAAAMYPPPRDYRKGVFKFTSTPYGIRPLRSDLVRTIRNGVRGTSMPDFKLLPQSEIEAVVDYVLFLSRRGELEEQLAALADAEGDLTPNSSRMRD